MLPFLKLSVGPIFVACLIGLGNSQSPDEFEFESVSEAVRYAERRLASDGRSRDKDGWSFHGCGGKPLEESPSASFAAFIVRYSYDDENMRPARLTSGALNRGVDGEFPPGKIRVLFAIENQRTINLIVRQRGYHDVTEQLAVEKGRVTVVCDLVLERATKENGAEVMGRVWLEDTDDLEGITVTLGHEKTKTGRKGEFRFEGVTAGFKILRADKKGYIIPAAQFNLERRERKAAAIKGFMQRTARVRWAYQPEKSRDLSDAIESGESVIGTEQFQQYCFADGLRKTKRQRDFHTRQDENELIMESLGGRNEAGIIQLADIEFDEVIQAPNVTYRRGPITLSEGDIFVFKTYDGEHFGKLKVIEIVAGNEARERTFADLARQPLEQDE